MSTYDIQKRSYKDYLIPNTLNELEIKNIKLKIIQTKTVLLS